MEVMYLIRQLSNMEALETNLRKMRTQTMRIHRDRCSRERDQWSTAPEMIICLVLGKNCKKLAEGMRGTGSRK